MEILVDYNNVLTSDRRKGIRYVTERILNAIGPHRLGKRSRASFRLYDGWYELQSLTRTAQEVFADVQANTPHTASFLDDSVKATVIVNVELAYSLRCDPTVPLYHTFRPKTPQSNVTCRSPRLAGCKALQCPLEPMATFISASQCPDDTCSFTPPDLLIRNEQKLVDAMMAADLFSILMTSAPEVVLVSSDDDLLPVIRLLVKTGMTVFHVLTRPPSQSMSLCLHGLDDNKYFQIEI